MTFEELPLGSYLYFLWKEGQGGSSDIVEGRKVEATRWQKTTGHQIQPVDEYGNYTGGQIWDLGRKVNEAVLQVKVKTRGS